jgi:hypothetical protein
MGRSSYGSEMVLFHETLAIFDQMTVNNLRTIKARLSPKFKTGFGPKAYIGPVML